METSIDWLTVSQQSISLCFTGKCAKHVITLLGHFTAVFRGK
jgi:sorbitol-specific phosphotransferase system component IIA